MHASSLSQVIASELLQRWGLKGFLQHVNAIETFYERRRDLMVAAADKHLTGLCEFSVPEGKQTAASITNTFSEYHIPTHNGYYYLIQFPFSFTGGM